MCDVLSGIIIKLQLQLGDKQCGRECAKSAQKTVGRLLRKCQIKFIDFHCSFEMEAVTPAGGPGSLKCEKPMTGDEGLTMCTFFFFFVITLCRRILGLDSTRGTCRFVLHISHSKSVFVRD